MFRTLHARGVTKRYPGSRVSFGQHKEDFIALGLLGLIERALARMEDGSYGFCETCGEAIDVERLMAIPETLHCARCRS